MRRSWPPSPIFGGPRLDPASIPARKSHALQRLTKQRGRFKDDIVGSQTPFARSGPMGLAELLEHILPDMGTLLSSSAAPPWARPRNCPEGTQSNTSQVHRRTRQRQSSPQRPSVETWSKGSARPLAARPYMAAMSTLRSSKSEVALEIDII